MIKKYTGGALYSDISREVGRWLEYIEPNEAEPFRLWMCSECSTVEKEKTFYCPMCGCKMEVEGVKRMTREEATKKIKKVIEESVIFEDELEAFDMAIKALEQEPILDKIRAEIEQIKEAEYQIYGKGSWRFVDKCLDIINKYKAESEGKE